MSIVVPATLKQMRSLAGSNKTTPGAHVSLGVEQAFGCPDMYAVSFAASNLSLRIASLMAYAARAKCAASKASALLRMDE